MIELKVDDNMNKNGYTLVELLGVIVLIAILSGLAVISVSYIIQRGKDNLYRTLESNLETAARNYAFDKINEDYRYFSSIVELSYEDLKEYLNDFKVPDGDDCSQSYVKIEPKKPNNTSNISLDYNVCLKCDKYQLEPSKCRER